MDIILECMDLDLSLREERLTSTAKNPNETKIEKWDRYNQMFLVMIKRSIPG